MSHLCRKNLKPIAGDLDRNNKFPTEQIQHLGKLGLMAINVDPDYGGSGLDTLSISLAVEEIARGCGGTGAIVSIHNCLYACLLNRLGTTKQKEQFLRPCTSGNIGAFALSESEAGSDVAALSTTATKDGDHWLLNGMKAWVTSAYEAKAAVIFATVDKTLQHKGITGIARASLDSAVEYASKRKAFGTYLIDMPAVKGHIADVALRHESARLLTWKAASMKDACERTTKYSSMAKIAASQCATFAAHTAMQIMGGMGYVNDMPAERHYRDARITEIYGGVTDIQKLVIADQVIREMGYE
ncbi:short-chain specific acyl-CoA dehydrogenase, mitochondrial-like [Ctenocephalides felis]|uniref:short-chain specific acyl-CoA dehydrogenase, mitochondrial-like n=1 Tax=Ctenocephalides felis TaxID=7515 RepID=UPI000E6E4A40|nr:short-chain specific acyl-CoA dehydrogenase, mitochondrial-like [Ctenocephalides felis]